MGYSDYGLDEKKLAQDPDSKVRDWSCLWCNETVRSGFNLCFSNWVICRDCVETAHESERWTEDVECWKCSTKGIKGLGCDPIWGLGEYYVCQPCIDWAKETFTKQDEFNNKERQKMTTEEILQQCRVEGQLVYLPDVMLDYGTEYVPVKKKLELIGGKWKGGKTSAFVFSEDPTDLLAAIQNGEQLNLKKEFQFFPTPDHLADTLVERAMSEYFKLYSGMPKILEPSAGDGALVRAVQRRLNDHPVDCFELMEINRIRLAKTPYARIIGNDFLKAVEVDTMNLIRNQYDLIVANPPFSKNQDIDHIQAMFECLKPGGTIVTMAGPSWKIGSQKKQVGFQQWLSDLNADIIEVDPGEFKESGTMIGTLLLVIRKPITIGEIQVPVSTGDCLEAENIEVTAESEDHIFQIMGDLSGDIDQLTSSETRINNKSETDMSFFTQLAALLGQAEISLTVKAKDENLTVMIMPKGATQLDKVKPLILSGNAADLDQEFFSTVSGSIQKMSGIISNVAEYEKSLNEAIVKTAAADDAKAPKSRSKGKVKDEPKPEVSPEEVNASPDESISEGSGATIETPIEPEVSQEELDRIAAEKAAQEEAKAAEERKARYGELVGKASSLIAGNNFALALETFEAAKEFADDPEALSGSIQTCKEEIERQDKFNTLLSKSKEFATALDWKNAAGALKQARTLSDEPESHDDQIKEYMQKALEAEMAAEAPSYL